MNELKCLFLKHAYELVYVFRVPVTNDDRTEVIMLAPVAYAMQCDCCGKRKLHEATNPYAKKAWGILEDAKMWVMTGIFDVGEPLIADVEEPEEHTHEGIQLVVDNHGQS